MASGRFLLFFFCALYLVSLIRASCVTCKDGSSCCDDEQCCDGGSGCCPNNSTCCSDTCCDSATESCCPDPNNGGVCCISELTYCCAPGDAYPSRCCPRWNVCCNGGRYGCCEPAKMSAYPLQADEDNNRICVQRTNGASSPKLPGNAKQRVVQGKILDAGGGNPPSSLAGRTVYALYVNGFSDMYGVTMDMDSGDVTLTKVSGFNDWGEIQRVFMFDANRKLFYLLQADFLKPAPHPIYLFTVDPTTGTTTSKQVKGATVAGIVDVTGYFYNPRTDNILMATEAVDNSNKLVGYNFYTINITTAVASQVSSYRNKTDTYVGWFYQASPDNKKVYRAGYADVFNQQQFGLSITDISSSTASNQLVLDIPIPSGLGYYMSLNVYGHENFISLAADAYNDLAVVKWNVHNATILQQLFDGYDTPYFGPLAEYINNAQTDFVALVVWDSSVDSDLDRWALVHTDLATGKTTEVVLYPWLLADIDSMCGLGML